jgi:cation:H+ antiporter
MIIDFLLIVVGFFALIYGANWLVDGAAALARKYKVSDLVIGLTIVAFGTSAPELVVNSIASVNGYSDIVLGNIIGSNNMNLFLILGLTGLIFPISVQSSTARKEIPISLFAALLLLFLLNDFRFTGLTSASRLDGLVLMALFGLFLYYVFLQMKKDPVVEEHHKPLSTFSIWRLIVFGLTGLILGGRLVVVNSVSVAEALGISEKIIGLTIVAAGTSLPELVTSVVAATKKNTDIAIGNIIGSNIFNILLILSVSSLINPITYNVRFNTDLYILIGGTLMLLLFMLTGKRRVLDRWEAGLLFGFYILYTTHLIMQEV